MGMDFEYLLGCTDGEDMADAYNRAIPDDFWGCHQPVYEDYDYETEPVKRKTEKVVRDFDDDAIDLDEFYPDEGTKTS